MYYHPQFKHPMIVRTDPTEEQLLRDIVYTIRNPSPFIIEPAYTAVQLVQHQINKGVEEPWIINEQDWGEFMLEYPDAVCQVFSIEACTLVYTLLKG